ncbi:hypothetical protein AZI86_01695 [Bdellovibrio bacteriovorus]|uniref:Uncharacterized protein n=1 Tax=Bdellovibrio bacteriovorus TaxID=959 RepID=A0A150WMX1_BDEBC|nr:hypothetical protein [Bdellovibrio bacteriovorus]KYG65812.1 hypothetical protein AZI86_01695 [Bdellovibrio bacteriovorus]
MSKFLLMLILILGFSAQTYGVTVEGHVAYGGDVEDLELSLSFHDLLNTLKKSSEAMALAPQISRADTKKLIVVFNGRPNGLERYRFKKRVWVDYDMWSQSASLSRLHIVIMSLLDALTFDGPKSEVACKLLGIFLREHSSREANTLGAIYVPACEC